MERTAKPVIAGICSIVAGALGVLSSIGFFIGSSVMGSFMMGAIRDIPRMMPGILIIIGVLLLIVSVIAIVGGIYALKRQLWGLALAGAILAIFSFYPPVGLLLGIAAIVLLILAKAEFV